MGPDPIRLVVLLEETGTQAEMEDCTKTPGTDGPGERPQEKLPLPNTRIVDFWLPELRDNKLLWFKPPQSVILRCSSSSRK